MRLLADTSGLVIIGGGLVVVLRGMTRRASTDWALQLRVIRTLALVASAHSPGEQLDLWEVEFGGGRVGAGTISVEFSPVDRPQDVGLLLLDAPLGEFADQCNSWCDAGTPLLFAADASGDAVIHGPDGCFVGRLAAWRNREPFDASMPW
jgi:hypothetical protein